MYKPERTPKFVPPLSGRTSRAATQPFNASYSRQAVVAWAICQDEDHSFTAEPILSEVGLRDDGSFIRAEQKLRGVSIEKYIPAVPGTFRITIDAELQGVPFLDVLGIQHPGDGTDHEFWEAIAKQALADYAEREV